MFYLHFLGNLCLLVKNVLKDGLFVIHVSIWTGDHTETRQTMFSYMTNVSGGLFFYCVTVRGTNVMTGS